MPLPDACNPLEESTAAGSNGTRNMHQPVLSDGEDQDPENHELIFEEKNEEETPSGIVGLMFNNTIVSAFDAANNRVEVPFHEKILM